MNTTTKKRPLADKHNLGIVDAAQDDGLDIRPEQYEAYAVDPQVRPSNALVDFWQANGDQRAFAYSHLYEIALNRSSGIELTFSDHLVFVRGHQLDDLYRQFKRHRVIYVWEADAVEQRDIDEDAPLVVKIRIERRE